jgi:hypothetical protein
MQVIAAPLKRLMIKLICTSVLGWAASTHAGNEHEHLQYLPNYDDIQSASGNQLGKIKTSELLSKDYREITSRFGPINLSEEEFLKLRKTKSFEDFSEVISTRFAEPRSTEQIMRSFFEIDESHAVSLESYAWAGEIRNKIFHLRPTFIKPAVLSAMNRAPGHQIRKCVFTIPKTMMEKRLLEDLVHEFERRRMQAQFYYSIPRRQLSNAGSKFDKAIEAVKIGRKEGWLHGIDIAGSLWDGIAEFNEAEVNLMKERLVTLFSASSTSDIGIRLHAFENGRKGGFYDALWPALEECKIKKCLPKKLRIGHIYDLDDASLNKLLKYVRKSDLVFEVNLESNYQLLAPRTDQLIKTIEKLHKKDLRVAIGSDGIGILGNRSSFKSTLIRFKKKGMNEASIQGLINEAYTPLTGSKFNQNASRAWHIEKERIRDELGMIPYPSAQGGSCKMTFQNKLRDLFQSGSTAQ